MSLNLWTSKQRTDICKTMPDINEGRLHPAVGRGIFTQVLRTEYQVAAGKTFVVPWWWIGVFDLDLHDCLWAVATHHWLQLSIAFCGGMHGPALLSAQALIIYPHQQYNLRRLGQLYSRGMFILRTVTQKWIFIMQKISKDRPLTVSNDPVFSEWLLFSYY